MRGFIVQGYEKYGFIVNERGDITYREWAPSAVSAHLIGDFSKQPTGFYHQSAQEENQLTQLPHRQLG